MFSEELSSDQLLSMTLVVIFTLHKNKPKEEDENEECIAEDEIKVWNLATKFAASIYNLFITLAQSHQTIDGKEENKFLPSIKVFSDWILCSGSSILLEKSFDRNKEYVFIPLSCPFWGFRIFDKALFSPRLSTTFNNAFDCFFNNAYLLGVLQLF